LRELGQQDMCSVMCQYGYYVVTSLYETGSQLLVFILLVR